jgi:integrase
MLGMHRSRAPSFPSRPGRARRQPRLRNGGKPACRPIHIAADLDLTRATVTCHLRRLRFEDPGVYEGCRAIVATLGGSGLRVSELCAIRMRDLRLHAASSAHFRIPDAKTEAGVREVQVSPDLLEEIVAHVDALRRVGLPTDPDAYLFCNRREGRLQRKKVNKIVREAAAQASQAPGCAWSPRAWEHAPHTLGADVHLDRATCKQLRRALGHASGRTRRLEDDDGRLRPAPAACGALTRRGVRRTCAARARAPLRHCRRTQ